MLKYFILLIFTFSFHVFAQDDGILESNEIDALLDELPIDNEVGNSESSDLGDFKNDKEILSELDEVEKETTALKDEELEDKDDLQALREDLGDINYKEPNDEEMLIEAFSDEEGKTEVPSILSDAEDKANKKSGNKIKIVNEDNGLLQAPLVFDVGQEEKNLLDMAKYLTGKTSNNEWNEIATASNSSTYTVVDGDWLWKISERLFGSGFYYSKIWALNPYITNPHLIEPGMTLVFTTGSQENMPEIKLGSFSKSDKNEFESEVARRSRLLDYSQWGDGSAPQWFKDKQELVDQGIYVQYATPDTMGDIQNISDKGLIEEYKKYIPPDDNIDIDIPDADYDSNGFDRHAKIDFPFKEGFYLNTFVSTNIVQDFGKIDSSVKEGVFLSKGDRVYLSFDSSMNVVAGDRYSIYQAGGEVKHHGSERVGFKYTIVANVQIIAPKDNLWLAEIIESTGVAQRGDRITVYTPKIERIAKTFNDQIIEAAIVASFSDIQTTFSFGDVLYLDRGRADGVEIGNVFEIYDFKDRLTGRNITNNPTYKTGELTVINVTDNFATGLVSLSTMDFYLGDIAVTKTKEAAAKASRLKNMLKEKQSNKLSVDDLEELDVELNIDEMTDELLDKADQIQFTEDELAELERQEREKSILKESERDLRSLEKLENEIEEAESLLNEAKIDEDKQLEDINLESVEKDTMAKSDESLEDIEESMGRRYMDQSLIEKENPYGLTEFDIEEIDELLNAEKDFMGKKVQKKKEP